MEGGGVLGIGLGGGLAAAVLGRLLLGELLDEEVGQALERGVAGLVLDLLHPLAVEHVDRDLDQVADDGLDVPPDVADLGELGRLDLDEGCVDDLGDAPRDLRLADAGRPDHEDVLRLDLLAQVLRK